MSTTSDDNDFVIAINIDQIKNIKPIFSFSDLRLIVEFMKERLYETELHPSEEYFSINHLINLKFTLDDVRNIDKIISNPLVLKLIEYEREGSTYSLTGHPDAGRARWRNERDVLELEQALLGHRTALESQTLISLAQQRRLEAHRASVTSRNFEFKLAKKAARERRGSRDGRTSRTSKFRFPRTRVRDSGQNSQLEAPIVGPQLLGIGLVDLSPLFLGVEAFRLELVLKSQFKKLDDRVRPATRLPRILIHLEINNPPPNGFMYSCCVESIYNLPITFSANATYQLCIHLPSHMNRFLVYDKHTFQEQPRTKHTFQKYSDSGYDSALLVLKDMRNVLTFKPIDFDVEEAVVEHDHPRIEFNALKRVFALVEDNDLLKAHIKKYRCFGLELYVTKTFCLREPSETSKQPRTVSKRANLMMKERSKKPVPAVSDVQTKDDFVQHYMGFLDVCRLLYPGEKYARIMAALYTFNAEEFAARCGVNTSYFRPARTVDAGPSTTSKPTVVLPKDSSMKSSRTSKSSKSVNVSHDSRTRVADLSNDIDLSSRLPDAPHSVVKMQALYNERGQQSFLIVEFEFERALEPAYKIEDASSKELPTKMSSHLEVVACGNEVEAKRHLKFKKSKFITEPLFRQAVAEFSKKLRYVYAYFKEKHDEDCCNAYKFIEYLNKNGYYQHMIGILMRSSLDFINTTLQFNPIQLKTAYHTNIAKVYIQLIETTNKVLIDKPDDEEALDPVTDFVRFGFEAMELDFVALAKRYFLQCICSQPDNAHFWCNFAIYNLHVGERERAFECAKEALHWDEHHRDALVLYGSMLARKKRLNEAETVLLNVTIHNPEWVEGWGSLYCIYLQKCNTEGMEIAFDLGTHYLTRTRAEPLRDLVWYEGLTPESFFFRVTRYFIKLRLLEEAEMMLASEIVRRRDGFTEYMLSVIEYYRKNYQHALFHIDNAINISGGDFVKCALKAHLFAVQDKPDCAIAMFQHMGKFFHQPGDEYFYVVYVQRGLCYSKLGEDQTARAEFLRACKLGGSAYTWLCAGVLYYHQHDYLSADECLTHSNYLDNRMAETWAYLALVNLKLGKPYEASICYHQTRPLRLENAKLLSLLDEEFNSFTKFTT